MIYDCFSYWDEDLLLDLRLNILNKIVDYFVIVEGNKTWQNNSKKLKFDIKKFNNFKNKIIYVPVTDSTAFTDKTLRPDAVPSLLRDVSATFFNFQPYVAMKWQFLERMGLRISVGFNKGTIGNGSWKLNGRTLIGDSPVAAIQGVTFRTMLYIGL